MSENNKVKSLFKFIYFSQLKIIIKFVTKKKNLTKIDVLLKLEITSLPCIFDIKVSGTWI